MSDTEYSSASASGSEDEMDIRLEKMITSKPLYYILAQYLETSNGKNVAECIADLTTAVQNLETAIRDLSTKK